MGSFERGKNEKENEKENERENRRKPGRDSGCMGITMGEMKWSDFIGNIENILKS